MTQHCRLLARAQMHGEIREPGYQFHLAAGELGPHRTVVSSHETIDLTHDNVRIPPECRDEPLYQVLIDGVWQAPVYKR